MGQLWEMQCCGWWNDLLGFAKWCCIVEPVYTHFKLCHWVTLGCQVNRSNCLLQYSPGPWSLDLLRRQDKALFYPHQRPVLGSHDRSGHCAEPPECGCWQYCVAMLSIIVSECRWEGMSRAKHWCSSQQFPLDHPNLTDACNKMHKQQFLHSIDPDTWKSADRLQLPSVQWDHQSSLKYGATWLTCQCWIPTRHWILLHTDWWSNNGNRPMLMLGPWRNCPEGNNCCLVKMNHVMECGSIFCNLCSILLFLLC